MKSYRNLFFDLDNTLWAFSENAESTFREIYELNELHRIFDSFEQFFNIYEEENLRLWGLYESGKIEKEELNYRRFRHPFMVAGVDNLSLGSRLQTDFFRIIKTKSQLMPHAEEVLKLLQPQYNLYILSNGFRELQCAKMRSGGIDKYFKQIILSDDIGILKPNKDLFDYALQQTGGTTDDSLMIGDNFKVDIMGAYHSGWQQMYYPSEDDKDSTTALPFEPTYLIHDLREILTLISPVLPV